MKDKKDERQKAIIRMLHENGKVNMDTLLSTFSVSRETIRNDLIELEKEQYLCRTFGGAVKLQQHPAEYHDEVPYYSREASNKVAKQEIAQLALNYIHEDDHIILDSSSTCVYLARALPNIHLVVMTNSVRIVSELAAKAKIEVYCAGGLFLRSSMCFVGSNSNKYFSNIHVNSTFISSGSLSADGTAEAHELAVMVKNEMIRASTNTYLLVDHSKFGNSDFVRIAPLDAYTTILTDSQTSRDQINALGPNAPTVVTAEPIDIKFIKFS